MKTLLSILFILMIQVSLQAQSKFTLADLKAGYSLSDEGAGIYVQAVLTRADQVAELVFTLSKTGETAGQTKTVYGKVVRKEDGWYVHIHESYYKIETNKLSVIVPLEGSVMPDVVSITVIGKDQQVQTITTSIK